MWYFAIGEIKRGMWCPKNRTGYLIQINNKVIITSGTFEDPKVVRFHEFKNQDEATKYVSRFI